MWFLPRSDSHLRNVASLEPAGTPACGQWWRTAGIYALSALMGGLTTAGFMVVPFISTYMVRNVGLTESQLKYNFLSGGVLHAFFDEF